MASPPLSRHSAGATSDQSTGGHHPAAAGASITTVDGSAHDALHEALHGGCLAHVGLAGEDGDAHTVVTDDAGLLELSAHPLSSHSAHGSPLRLDQR